MNIRKKAARSLSLAVILALLTVIYPAVSGSGTAVFAAGDFEINSEGVLENYNGKGGNITVPTTAKAIGDEAFYGCGNITGITLPSSVKTVGKKAFANCAALQKVSIPTSVRTIGDRAFDGCPKLSEISVASGSSYYLSVGGVLFNAGKTLLIRYPEGIASSSYTVPAGVRTVGPGAFYRCAGLKKITLPSGLTSIGEEAFREATGITGCTIPSTVTSIGNSAFYSATSLRTLSFECGSPSVGSYAFKNTSVSRILYAGSSSQWGSTQLSDIFGSSVMVYYNMSGFDVDDDILVSYNGTLESVSVPGFIVGIDDSAFSGCTSIKSVTLPNSLKYIGQSAFDGCSSLERVTIPSSVESVGKWAFDRCSSLTKISVVSDNENYSASGGVLFNKFKTELIRYPQGLTAESYTIPSTVTRICDSAFSLCSNLRSVTLPSGVETVEAYAFDQCAGLTEVTLPSTVKTVGKYAFRLNRNLSAVKIEAISPKIDATSFKDAGVTTVNYAGTRTQWESAGLGSAFGSGVNVHFKPDGFVIEGTVLKQYNGTAASVTVPDTVTEIGESAFNNCASVTKITVPSGVTKIGDSAFAYCEALTEVNLPASVTSIGKWAFDSCPKLTAINVASANTKYSSVGGVLYSDAKTRIVRYPSGKTANSYTLDSAVKVVGDSAFAMCDRLTGIHIPSGVTTLEQYAFDQCSGLTSVTLPSTVTSVAGYAFRCNTRLRTAVLLARSPSVAATAFYADSLATVCFAGSRTQWNSANLGNVFSDASKIYYDYAAPKIVRSPESRSVVLGDSITLSAEASGSGLSYQWYFKKAGATSWSVWNNRTSASETVTPNATWDGIRLYCRVKDAAGVTVSSGTATVTLRQAITVTSQPKSVSAEKGSAITVSLRASGSGLTYQWYFKKKGQTAFSPWNGRTRASETVTPNDTWNGIQLYCLIRDAEGHSLKSDVITVTLREPLRITADPQSMTVRKGSTVKFTVKATGAGLQYQWYFKKKGQTSWSVWKGRTGTSETVTPNDTWDGIQIYCKVTDAYGISLNSKAATLRFGIPLKIVTQPVNRTFSAGETITLSLRAEGTELQYQWYFKKAGQTSFSKWIGRTGPSEKVAPNATWDGIRLYCVITDGAGASVRSDVITVTAR